jgi:archaellum component FlaC
MDKRLDAMNGRLNSMDERLNSMDGRLTTVERDVSQMKETLGGHTALLTQILERLP